MLRKLSYMHFARLCGPWKSLNLSFAFQGLENPWINLVLKVFKNRNVNSKWVTFLSIWWRSMKFYVPNHYLICNLFVLKNNNSCLSLPTRLRKSFNLRINVLGNHRRAWELSEKVHISWFLPQKGLCARCSLTANWAKNCAALKCF